MSIFTDQMGHQVEVPDQLQRIISLVPFQTELLYDLALGALGTAGIPPGGFVTYLLLPLWLIAASILMARQQRAHTTTTHADNITT